MEGALESPVEGGRDGWLKAHRRTAIGAIALLVLAPVLWWVGTRPIATSPGGVIGASGAAQGVGAQAGKEAPNFKLRDPDGKTVELKQFRGKPVLLNFWATWCAPCKEEMPELEQLYRQYKDRGLVVLGVSVDDSSSVKGVPALLKAGNPEVGAYTFPVALDEKQEVTRQYHLLGVPSSFFVDKNGVVRVIQPRVMSRSMMLDGLKIILPSVQ